MAKKNPGGSSVDRHRSRFTIRLPEAYREPVAAVSRNNRRTITEEVKIALDKHIKDEGGKPPATV